MKKNLVSVIIPTCNRYDVAARNVANLQGQNWPNIEIIVCDDSDKEEYHRNSSDFRTEILAYPQVYYHYVARFDIDGRKDYGLARARNFGITHSDGEFMVFLDDRVTAANKKLVRRLVMRLQKDTGKLFVFGDKGSQKKSFVENCSAVRRKHIVDAGMFCERIDEYGGMTREIHRRLSHQGFQFEYVPAAKAKQLHKSTGWDEKPSHIMRMRQRLTRMFD